MSRAPIGGADVPGIATYARVEPEVARASLNRLRSTGRVRRYGNTRFARYILVNRRQRRARRRP